MVEVRHVEGAGRNNVRKLDTQQVLIAEAKTKVKYAGSDLVSVVSDSRPSSKSVAAVSFFTFAFHALEAVQSL